jgi:kynurenine formamidase
LKIHISSSDLLAIESTEKETPDKDAVKQAVEKVLLKENITGWHSVEIEQFSHSGKLLIIAIPARVYMPKFLINLL